MRSVEIREKLIERQAPIWGTFIVATVLLAGCGGSDTTAAQPTKTAAHSYRQQVRACVEGLGFDTRPAGNAMRVESPGGRLIANIQIFHTKLAARRFGSRLLVDGNWGGKGVAVWLRDASGDDKATVQDCLTP